MLLNLTLLTSEWKLCKEGGNLEVDMKYIENDYQPSEMNTTDTCKIYFTKILDTFAHW